MKLADWLLSIFGFKKEARNGVSIQSQQRSQQITNNYFIGPGVGDPKELLSGTVKQMPEREAILDIQEIGRQLISDKSSGILFTEVAIQTLGQSYQRVFAANEVSRNASSYLNGAMFALGTKNLRNPEWKEHCASSLRELFHHWKGAPEQSYSHFKKAFGSGSTTYPIYAEHQVFCMRLKSYYQYFSGKCHHKSDNAVFALQALCAPEQIKAEHDTDDKFLEVVRRLLVELKEFTERYPI